MHVEKLNKILPLLTKNFSRLNKLLKSVYKDLKLLGYNNSFNSFCNCVKTLNPLLLNSKVRKSFKFNNPMDEPFDIFINHANNLMCKIPLTYENVSYNNNKTKQIDFTKQSELLFLVDNESYYGYREVVFDMINMFNDTNYLDFTDPIVLNVSVPKYVISLYLESCHGKTFDITNIKVCDLQQFLNFIDQYPTKNLSIHLIEKELLKFMNDNSIVFDDYLKNICYKYKLKYMYLYFNHKLTF